MDLKRILARYCHLNPGVDASYLKELLTTAPNYFRWAGADLFYCTDENGNRKMVVIETNSCPSGQKSQPLLNEHDEMGAYRVLIEKTLKPVVEQAGKKVPGGALAVIYDKNLMEAGGYAAVMAELFDEPVYLAEYYTDDANAPVRWVDGVMEVRVTGTEEWKPIRCAFRYVTQKPWNRFPIVTAKTSVLNPVIACLAGGRNKLIAAKAYDFFNNHSKAHGLEIVTPETIRDVSRTEVPLWVASFGYKACVKNPLSNAGQGVTTITSKAELDAFMASPDALDYNLFIVQALIGDYSWSSSTRQGQYFHVGTVPDKQNRIFCCDLRMMIHYDFALKSWRPLVMYSRRAEKPLKRVITEEDSSWEMLGTNLSYKDEDGKWQTDTTRLMIMDRKDFNKLGAGLDNLIEGFIQTVMATRAIDDMATKLASPSMHSSTDGSVLEEVPAPTGEAADPLAEREPYFNKELFYSLNKDDLLMSELVI